ncbi:helix-turn-helix domain-containing protein [Sporosarcina sp. HYO08]|uniref:helix-turn-helix domain-containing protein n=1 Tax=Sporosarcina sp. HYO08 TaxID=1759557 RepID=UPI0007968DE0|nr:helix-turn-helix domain-containing protein [Sporosarcina sp. HYO08]KXH82044.1 hypothetical protein AU377_07270 [Sporosarcina sp. HYO08]
MELSSILLKIIDQLDGERTIYAGYHLLRGKRSGQTLQDVEYYGLKPYFHIIPNCSKEIYDEAVNKLCQAHLIYFAADSFAHTTEKGKMEAQAIAEPQFNGWNYRGRELLFFSRLSLIVQAASHLKAGEPSFMPIQKNVEVQSFVKEFARSYSLKDPVFASTLKEELLHCMEKSGMTEEQKFILIHRLSGYRLTGWTWDQLSEQLQYPVANVRLLYIESLHRILKVIEASKDMALLPKIAENIKVTSYLTESANKTKQLFEMGLPMTAIAGRRKLKMSTIEDHFVEMAINDQKFPLTQFVSEAEAQAVVDKVRQIGTKRLRILKDQFPALSYFQLRLILGARTGGERS